MSLITLPLTTGPGSDAFSDACEGAGAGAAGAAATGAGAFFLAIFFLAIVPCTVPTSTDWAMAAVEAKVNATTDTPAQSSPWRTRSRPLRMNIVPSYSLQPIRHPGTGPGFPAQQLYRCFATVRSQPPRFGPRPGAALPHCNVTVPMQ